MKIYEIKGFKYYTATNVGDFIKGLEWWLKYLNKKSTRRGSA